MATTGSSAPKMPQNTITFPARAREDLNPLEYKDYPNRTENHDHDNNNYRVRVRAHAREMNRIHDAYEDILGRSMPRFVEEEILGMIADGAEPSFIRAVIEYTACAPRPSWAYARAVIYRNMKKGVTHEGTFMASLADRGRDGDELPY